MLLQLSLIHIFKAIVPYELKRAVKIVFAPKTAEEKAAIKAHKEAMQDKYCLLYTSRCV